MTDSFKMYPRKPYYKRPYPVTTTFKPYKSALSTSMGAARASKNATKLNYFNCTVNGNIKFQRDANAYYSDVCVFTPVLGGVDATTGIVRDDNNGSIYGGLVNDRSFRLNCAQYDEMRIVSMKVRINMANNEEGTMTLCTIVDRNAHRAELEMDQAVMSDLSHDVPNFREVCESQGSNKTIVNKNRITPITRMIFARDMTEKITYTDCSIEYNTTQGESPVKELSFNLWPNFKPALYCCIQFSNTSVSNKVFTFGYSVEYNVIFRNPKSDLNTFITKENPTYVNPDNRSLKLSTTVIKSDDPYIPDMYLENGVETNMSWYKRYLARISLKKATKLSKSDEPLIITEQKEDEKKPMDIEDDPGTA